MVCRLSALIEGIISVSPPEIQSAIDRKEFYLALGDNLIITCEAAGSVLHDYSLGWYHGQTWINESVVWCPSQNKTFCLRSRAAEIFRHQRVRSLSVRVETCKSLEQGSIVNHLIIVMANWTDNGSLYRCVSTARSMLTNGTRLTQEVHPVVFVG